MEIKKLYNIETDTLIILNPHNFELLIKKDFIQTCYLEIEQFTIIYFMCICHPNAVKFNDFKTVLTDLGFKYPGKKVFINHMSDLKKGLYKHGIKDFIIKVQGYGYIISNKWVFPDDNSENLRKHKFSNFNKLLEFIFPQIRNN